MNRSPILALCSFILLPAILSGCGDSSSDPVTSPITVTTLTGVFADAPVSGIAYSSTSNSGVTNDKGEFNYVSGEIIDFYFDPIVFGSALGKEVLTPMDLMNADTDNEVVRALVSLLQSLDADQNLNNGIQLIDAVATLIQTKLADGGDYSSILNTNGEIDFTKILSLMGDNDPNTPDELTDALNVLYGIIADVAAASQVDGIAETDLVFVDPDTAVANILADDLAMFRKNVSKTQDLASAKAKMNIMTIYTPAMQADETLLAGPDAGGVCAVGENISGVCKVHPIVITYTDEVGTTGAADAFAAISRDDGATWKRANLARSADNFSDSVPTVPGNSRKPVMQAKGNKVIVVWTDKYCQGGSPLYSLTDDADPPQPLVPDYYGVAGSQGLIDYNDQVPALDADRIPIPPIQPYSCLWASRSTVDEDTGAIQWYKAERITSGTRDAFQVFVGGASAAGFGVTWQEDPEGLRAGQGFGPGDGFSGATANHKTDVWYSFIKWADFDVIDPNDVPLGEPAANDDGGLPRVRALNRMSIPVRLSDNDVCNPENSALDLNGHEFCRLDASGNLVDATVPNAAMVNCTTTTDVSTPDGTAQVCVTADGRVLDGDTGGTRPNLFLQPYTKPDGSVSAWAILAYEETKGEGGGPSVVPEDEGKNVIYHSFDFSKPEKVAGGDIVNLPERDVNGDVSILGTRADGSNIYATENARRVRFILQGKKPSLGKDNDGDGIGDTGAGTVLLAIYKQGPEGKGRPSDIFLRRMTVRNPDGTVKTGNPYKFTNIVCDEADAYGQCLYGALNMSSVTATVTAPPSAEDSTPDGDGGIVTYDKILAWDWTTANFADESWFTPMTESRAHRGQIRGDFVAMGYSFTPNWAASRNGKDKYDFYLRRSHDGGVTWTTDPAGSGVEHCNYERTNVGDEPQLVCEVIAAGANEPPRNLSLLKNATESVIEPRIVAPPGTIASGQAVDIQNPKMFTASYGLADNVDPDNATPTDMYYSFTTDKGETFAMVLNQNTGEPEWDWLAKRSDIEEGEAQLRVTPDGSRFYATWLSESGASIDASSHFYGSDIWFRKIGLTVAEPVVE